MKCAEQGCLASIAWTANNDDPTLATVAKKSGWRMFEGKGWLCPHHRKEQSNDK